MSSSEKDKPSKASEQESAPKKRRWRKILGVLLFLLVAFLIILNGPGSRWFLRKTIIDQLAAKGMAGDTEVSGNLWSGYSLENISFTGSGPWKELEAERLAVGYRLGKIISDREAIFESLEAENVRAVITLEPKEDDEEESDWRSIFDTLRTAQPYVISGRIDVSEVTVVLLDEERGDRTISLQSVTHEAEATDFRINQISPGKLLPTPPPPQDLVLTWEKDSLALDQFTVTPGLQVKDLNAEYPEGETIAASLSLLAGESPISLAADETGKVDISLEDPTLELAPLFDSIGLEHPVGGAVSALKIDVSHLLESPQAWRGDVEISSKQVTWDERPLPDVEVTASLDAGNISFAVTVAEDAMTLDVRSETPVEMTPDGFRDLPLKIDFSVPSVATIYGLVEDALGPEKKSLLEKLPVGTLHGEGTLTTGSDEPLKEVLFDWTGTDLAMRQQELPSLKGSFSFSGLVLQTSLNRIEDPEGETFDLSGGIDLNKKSYQATAQIDLKESEWFGNLLLPSESGWKTTGPFIASWSGSGHLIEKTHEGKYALETLTLATPEETQTNGSLNGTYQWPGEVSLESLALRNGALQLTGGMNWTKKKTTFNDFVLEDGKGKLASVTGSGPGGPTLDDLLAADTPFDLSFKAEKLRLQRLRDLLPLPLEEGYKATLDGELHLGGVPEQPELDGSLTASEIAIPQEGIPPLAVTINLSTATEVLQASGEITEPGGTLATLRASVPVDVKGWAEDPERLKELPLDATVLIDKLPLARLQAVSAQLADVDGTLTSDITLSGTASEPEFVGSLQLGITRYPIPIKTFNDLTDTNLKIRFDREKVVIEPSQASIAGGKIFLSGEALLTGEEPSFDFTVRADNALLWRDDLMVSRTSGSINLRGPLSAAKVSGRLGIVESLVYKDIEIIPIGGTSHSSVAAPELPKFETKKTELVIDLPEPVANWALDFKINTTDPVLVRGNLATGQATANINIGGTLSRPEPSGKIELDDIVALLPFSTLTIDKGTIRLRPNAPLDPTIDIRGISNVDSYRINAYVFGTPSNPQYNLSSNPPLPESEILTLIASGTTTEGLEDPNLARMRFFQLVLDETRRKANAADAGRVLKTMRTPLNAIKDLDLRVGENDPFSGRQFNSASLKVSDKWAGVVQFDDEGNTRGLLRYSIRFK